MIIELCGIPGAGKTTISEYIKRKIEEVSNNNVLSRNDLMNSDSIRNYTRWINKVYPYFCFEKSEAIIRSFAKQYPDCDRAYIIHALILAKALNTNYDSSKCYMLDEGPIQFLTSIPHDKLIESNNILYELKSSSLSKSDVIIYCKCDYDVVAERIVKRNREGDRFYFEDATKIINLLKTKDNNIKKIIDTLSNSNKIFTLDCNKSIDNIYIQIDKIIKHLTF